MVLDGPLDTAVTPQLGSQLLTALREALTQSGNAAQATRVAVAVVAADGEVSLTITPGRGSARPHPDPAAFGWLTPAAPGQGIPS